MVEPIVLEESKNSPKISITILIKLFTLGLS